MLTLMFSILNIVGMVSPAQEIYIIREFKLHVYAKRQTSDSSREFLRMENEQIKTPQKIIWIFWKIAWDYSFMNRNNEQ